MSQIHSIVKALKEVTADTATLAALLPGNLHQGTDAARDALRPFGLLTAEQVASFDTSAGVRRVVYRVTLQVIADERMGTLGDIIETFHLYWDKLRSLPDLNPDRAKLIQIYPEECEAGELDQQDLGKDIVSGITSWTLELAEHQLALEV